MKKVISILLTLTLATSLFVLTPAAQADPSSQITNEQYGFTVTEHTDSNLQTVRVYSAADNIATQSKQSDSFARGALQESDTYQETKAILSTLGMGEEFIDRLSDERLEAYRESEQIMIATTYQRVDAEGNTTNVTKEEAENAANGSRGALDGLSPPEQNLWQGSGWDPNYHYNFTTDTYMRLSLAVTYEGDGLYHYSVNAEWLNTPSFVKGYDSIGACAYRNQIHLGTRSGWVSYTGTKQGEYEFGSEETRAFTSQQLDHIDASDNWFGSCAVFRLPGYDEPEDSNIVYSDIKVHYEFDAVVDEPQSELNFNVYATYDHATLDLKTEPTVSIGTGGASVSIGFELVEDLERRVVYFYSAINYTPDED